MVPLLSFKFDPLSDWFMDHMWKNVDINMILHLDFSVNRKSTKNVNEKIFIVRKH